MQIWCYDENKVFTESIFVDELIENMTTVPILIGYVKTMFDEDKQEWYEGATQAEIEEYWKEQEENKPSKEPSKVELLEEETLNLTEQNFELDYRVLMLEFGI